MAESVTYDIPAVQMDGDRYDKEYRRFMNFVCSYTMAGKNKWDDCVDALSMLADYAQTFTSSRVEVMRRPW